jgi:hypothetical protein
MPAIRRKLPWLLVVGVVSVLTLPSAAATDGQPLIISGGLQSATGTTGIPNTSTDGLTGVTSSIQNNDNGIVGHNDGAGNGVEGTATQRNGVYGHTNTTQASGVYGENLTGGGVRPYGSGQRRQSRGVSRQYDQRGWRCGPPEHASSRTGPESRSSRPARRALSSPWPGSPPSSMVMVTAQRNGGFFASAVAANGSFTIYLNKAPVAPATVKVA